MASAQVSNQEGKESKQEAALLQREPAYHGYLPREDLAHVLHRHGDFILRTTEVNDGAPEEKKPRKKELVLAVLVDPEGKCNGPIENETKDTLIKNLIINRVANRYAIEAGFRFDSIGHLIKHYTATPVKINNTIVQLIRGVRHLKWEFYHKDVTVFKLLGQGAFGEVHKGAMMRENKHKKMVQVAVAIKSLKTNSAAVSKEQVNEMMREARLMRNLSHPNVVRIYGVALCQQPLYILLEYVQGGSLDVYLKKHATILDRDEKLGMTMGAVWGVEYLHRSMILHRDIASRNCLYDEGKNVKISDFGLSRNGTIYRMKTAKKMPIKWMAPESINQFVFTQKTDVYSLGVLIWEIHACKESYDGLSNTDSRNRINTDKWNEFPEATPGKLKTYVKEKMWDKDPGKRANMQNIRHWMETFTGLTQYTESVEGGQEEEADEAGGQQKKARKPSSHNSTQSHTSRTSPDRGEAGIHGVAGMKAKDQMPEEMLIGPAGTPQREDKE